MTGGESDVDEVQGRAYGPEPAPHRRGPRHHGGRCGTDGRYRLSLALGCYIGLSAPEVLAVAFLFTALLTIYAVTVRALCLEYRKSGLAD